MLDFLQLDSGHCAVGYLKKTKLFCFMKKIKKRPSPAQDFGNKIQLTSYPVFNVNLNNYLKLSFFSNAGVVESGLRRWTYDPVGILPRCHAGSNVSLTGPKFPSPALKT